YMTAYTAHRLLSGEITPKSGETFEAGKLGGYTVEVDGEDIFVLLGPPFQFNTENIDEWSKVY
ncbi:MAG: rhamnose ABC transporter substrate-binding protein, partial [Anaerolineae bacterium]